MPASINTAQLVQQGSI